MVKGRSGVKGVAVLTYFSFLWSVQGMNASNILVYFHCRNFALASFYSLWGSYGEKPAPSAQIRPFNLGSVSLLQKLAYLNYNMRLFYHQHVPSSLLYTILFHRTFVLTVLSSLTLGTTLPRLLISYTALTHPHTPTHRTYLCTYSHTRCEAVR